MSDVIRFHLDENVDPAVADGLRRRGVDVTTSHDAGLLQATDDRQLEFARAQNRVLVTHDEDFLIRAKGGTPHAGIAYCHPQSRSIGQIIASLMLIRDCLSPNDMHNHVEFL
jgi:predicted nuclease of predicted toxin-antitoxin system